MRSCARRRNDFICGENWFWVFGEPFHAACSSWAYAFDKSCFCWSIHSLRSIGHSFQGLGQAVVELFLRRLDCFR